MLHFNIIPFFTYKMCCKWKQSDIQKYITSLITFTLYSTRCALQKITYLVLAVEIQYGISDINRWFDNMIRYESKPWINTCYEKTHLHKGNVSILQVTSSF